MDWSTLKTDVADYLARTDLPVTLVPKLINQALHKVERMFDWNHMEVKTTGTVTASSDTIAVPTRYKNTKVLFVTIDSEQREMKKVDYKFLHSQFPLGSSSPSAPEMFALLQGDGYFYLRPYPDTTYSYTFITRRYSADLSDANTSNWFMENAWEVLFYGALLLAEPYLKNPSDMPIWEKFYTETINELIGVSIVEETEGSYQNVATTLLVV